MFVMWVSETLEYDRPDQPALSVPKPLDLPEFVTRDFKGDYSSLEVMSQLGKGGLDTVTVYSATWSGPEDIYWNERRVLRERSIHHGIFESSRAS